MQKYTSGRNRVHNSHTLKEINDAIAEYTAYAEKHPGAPLSVDLLACVTDLHEELKLRESLAAFINR